MRGRADRWQLCYRETVVLERQFRGAGTRVQITEIVLRLRKHRAYPECTAVIALGLRIAAEFVGDDAELIVDIGVTGRVPQCLPEGRVGMLKAFLREQ